jgi:hypothetical protein
MRDCYAANKRAVDAELMTASVYGADEKSSGIPSDGSIIRVQRVWKLELFAEHSCQFTTSLSSIVVETA